MIKKHKLKLYLGKNVDKIKWSTYRLNKVITDLQGKNEEQSTEIEMESTPLERQNMHGDYQ